MTVKKQVELFIELFPWFAPDIVRYKGNRSDGGVDIFLKNERSLHFRADRHGWCLNGGH